MLDDHHASAFITRYITDFYRQFYLTNRFIRMMKRFGKRLIKGVQNLHAPHLARCHIVKLLFKLCGKSNIHHAGEIFLQQINNQLP